MCERDQLMVHFLYLFIYVMQLKNFRELPTNLYVYTCKDIYENLLRVIDQVIRQA